MKFDIITLFPEMFSAIKEEGVIARAMKKSLISIHTWQLRDFSSNKYKNVDEKPYGGGAGMVIQVKPIRDCVAKIKQSSPNTKVIYLSPQGKKLDQQLVEKLATFESITMLCGRYEGVDERVIENDIDFEISIGDYVISNGELSSMIIFDSIIRLVPGVLNDLNSAMTDSFVDDLLDAPYFTRPNEIDGLKVPDVLLSGNHQLIEEWKNNKKIEITRNKRPDLWKKYKEKKK